MSFVPPVFSKFGKVCSDLLDKKWEKNDFQNQVSVKSVSKGVAVTSKITHQEAENNAYGGKVTLDYKDKSFGKLTTEVDTDKSFKGTVELNSIYPGVVAKSVVKASSGKVNIFPETTVEYVNEPVALTAAYNPAKGQTAVSAALGYEGFSCGFGLNKSSDASAALGYGAGLQYEDGSIVGTAVVSQDYTVGLSLYHRVSSIFQLGVSGVIAADAKQSTVSVGSQYEVSPTCYVKGKIVVDGEKSSTLYGYVEHRIKNPDAVVGVTGSYNNNSKNAKFGVSFAFGDY